MIFTTYGRTAPTVRSHVVNTQSTLHICDNRTNPPHSGILSESTRNVPRTQPCLLASFHPPLLFFCSLGSSHTHFLFLKSQTVYFFFVTALAQLGELPSSLYIPVTSQMSPLQRDLPKLCSPGSSRTHVLSPQSVMFFPQSYKNNSLSPETGFIYLAQII